jgi:hypothetical protein
LIKIEATSQKKTYFQIYVCIRIHRNKDQTCLMMPVHVFTWALSTTNFLDGSACWVTTAGGSGHLAGTGEGNTGYVDSGTSCSAHVLPSRGMLMDDSCKVF